MKKQGQQVVVVTLDLDLGAPAASPIMFAA
jgi:hypothetical protein